MANDSEDPIRDLTLLIHAVSEGDLQARERLFTLLYEELHSSAARELAKGPAQGSMQPTALVNEAYIRLLGRQLPHWENRRHFFFTAARAMRDVMVERARSRQALRRGGEWKRVTLAGLMPTLSTPAEELLLLESALQQLEKEDQRKAEVVQLRFFAGLDEDEVAAALGVSKRTVSREWALARARLAVLAQAEEEG